MLPESKERGGNFKRVRTGYKRHSGRAANAVVYYAKSPKKNGEQETVRQHLQKVEELSGEYGRAFGAQLPARLCGLFHDFGKYSAAFQEVLRGTQEGIDHAIGGAAFLYYYQQKLAQKPFRPVIEAVAAHHSCLASQEDMAGILESLLQTSQAVTTLCGKRAALSQSLSAGSTGFSV